MSKDSDVLRQSYIDLSGVLIGISTFAGTVTLSTQFLINCPGSLLQTCLEISAQLFLVSPLTIMAIYGLLHGIEGRINLCTHTVVLAQFVLVEILMISAFIYLAIAILEFEGKRLGWAGIGLVAAMGLMLVVCHVVNYVGYRSADSSGICQWFKRRWAALAEFGTDTGKSKDANTTTTRAGEPTPTMRQIVCILGYVCSLLIEYAAMVSFLVNAIIQSTRAPTFNYIVGERAKLPSQLVKSMIEFSEAENKQFQFFEDAELVIVA